MDAIKENATVILKKGYLLFHGLGHRTLPYNPFIPKIINGRPVKYGFISSEHRENARLDDDLANGLKKIGVDVRPYRINVQDYKNYLAQAQYPGYYYSYGLFKDREASFAEKTLEHFVSADLLKFEREDVFIDIAADKSPFYQVVQKIWGTRTIYRQDLKYKPGIHNNQIGGCAETLPLPGHSVSKATLHCSFEHFEGESDVGSLREMARVLKPKGKLCILPLYLGYEYTIHTDPIYNIFFGRRLQFDPDAQIRYCTWSNRYTRHYSVEQFQERILPFNRDFQITVYRVENYTEVHSGCYLRFIGLFEKK